VRVGMRLGPFYASTSTRHRRGSSGGGGALFKLVGILILIGWPLALGQKQGGGYHPWVWLIAVPWWILLALVAIGFLTSKNVSGGAKKQSPPSQRQAS
jgi:hypothetical protein